MACYGLVSNRASILQFSVCLLWGHDVGLARASEFLIAWATDKEDELSKSVTILTKSRQFDCGPVDSNIL